MKTVSPDHIVVVTEVGHDDQYENSNINHCAVRITREALPTLKQRLAFYADHKDSVDLYGVDFRMPDGMDVCFFDVDHMGPMSDTIEQAMQQANGKVAFRGAEAEAVWDQAEDAESESAWRVSGSSLKVYDEGLFFLESNYKHATGGVQTPEFDFKKIEGYFTKRYEKLVG